MKPFARIPAAIPRSGIREIMDLAWAVEKTGEVIHLEVGQPDFATPESIVEATCRYARAGHTKYVPNGGVDALRAAAARHFERRTGVPTTSENILVTPGAVMSVATSFLSLLEPGDEVLLPDPGWPNYEMAVSIVHGQPVFYNLRAENHFLPDLDEIDHLVSPRTKLLLLCTPSNPTGQVYDEALMRQLMDLAQRHDLWVLSDEIYSQMLYDGTFHSITAYDGMTDLTIILDGFSKTYAMTGWRLGYGVMPEPLADHVTRLMTNCNSCTASFTQRAGLAALQGPQDAVGEMMSEFRRRRDLFVAGLNDIDGIRCAVPGGAFYAFPNITGLGRTSKEVADYLLQEGGVAALAGDDFGPNGAGYVRFSYANSLDNLKKALERIADCAAKLQG